MFEPPTDEVGITQHHLAAENITASPFELVPNHSNTGAREPYRRHILKNATTGERETFITKLGEGRKR